MRKYKNLVEVKLFGKYTDPYIERRVPGPIIPDRDICLPGIDLCGQEIDTNEIYMNWLGHSSVFLRTNEWNMLIDPVFSEYTSPVRGFGPKRFPGRVVGFDEIPVIDFLLITHNHYDHLDKKTIQALDKIVQQYIVPAGVRKNLLRMGVDEEKIREMNWWDSVECSNTVIVFAPTQHDASRSFLDMNTTLWGSYLITYKGKKIYHSGDGGYNTHFRMIYEKYGEIDAAFMECGQYNERWHAIHMFPEEVVEASVDLHAKLVIPIHWGTYCLSDHSWNEPTVRFMQRADEKNVAYRILQINEGMVLRNEK